MQPNLGRKMMKKIRVMTVFGTRPEAIKMAPLVLELQSRETIESIVCVTAQHREMLDQILVLFGINPDYDLDIMRPNQTLAGITSRVLTGIDEVLEQAQPDIVLVHGDTSTTFAGALAAFYHKIPVGHVEAGLRTYDMYSPFPEEINRSLVGRIAALNFSPTAANAQNLERESTQGEVFITGNTVIDAMKTTIKADYEFRTPELRNLDFENKRVILVTAHRRENYGEPMENIMRALKTIADSYDDVVIVDPVHLSPYVTETVGKYLGNTENVLLLKPFDTDEMHNLIARCYMVMTDSGGIQEEAPSLGKPVLVMRQETERPEAVAAGTVKLCGVEYENILNDARELLENTESYVKMANAVNPYGDGEACRRTVDAILWHFGRGKKPDVFSVAK